MNKQEFFIKWRNPQYADWNLLRSDIDLLIQNEREQALSEHEAWKPYPENKPKENQLCCVMSKSFGLSEVVWTYKNGDFQHCMLNVIFWRPFPAPYRKEGE